MSSSVLKNWGHLVASTPEAIALIDPNSGSVSISEIEERSEALREQWGAMGIRQRRLVALNLTNGTEWLCSFLACLKLGAVVVPLDPGFSEEEVRALSRDLRVQALWDGVNLIQDCCPSPYVFRRNDIELAKLTSGSTGVPKKLFFTGEEMMADARHLIEAMGICSTDVNLGVIPWGHSYGLGSIVYPLLLQGTAVAWTKTPFPDEIASVCRQSGCTLFPSVPTVLRAMSRSNCDVADFRSLRLIISAGARLDPEIARLFLDRFGKRVHNFYGSTETGGICFDDTGDSALSGRSVGKPLAGVSIVPTRGNRFFVKSGAVYRFGNRNRCSDDGEGMALVADFGRIDSNGELALESRAVNLMKIGARRINPLDIEKRLTARGEVSDAKVFALVRDGEGVIAAAIESSLGREELAVLIKDALPLRLRPKKWRSYEQFPATARGKVDFASIRRDFSAF